MNQIKVKLLRISGSDADVVKYARVSSGHTNEIDQERFIKWLAKKGHDTPQEYISTAWEIEAPQRISTQIVRHRMATHSVASARYGHKFTDIFFAHDSPVQLDRLRKMAIDCLNEYNELMLKYPDDKRLREIAAMYLPQGCMVKQIININFRSLKNFLNLRDSPEAQEEIRFIAQSMKEELKLWISIRYSVKYFLGIE